MTFGNYIGDDPILVFMVYQDNLRQAVFAEYKRVQHALQEHRFGSYSIWWQAAAVEREVFKKLWPVRHTLQWEGPIRRYS